MTEAAGTGERQPEQELLLLCARTRLDEGARRRLLELLDAPLNWDRIRAYTNRHHTSALLFHHLSATAPEAVPSPVYADLRGYYFHLAARNLRVVGRTSSILASLEEAGTPGVLWKGPALAYTVYPSPELRTFTDADIVVRRGDVRGVRQVMEADGFLPRPRIGVTPDELFERRGEVVTMWSEEAGIGVDVHWGSTGRYLSPVMDCEQLWHRSDSLELGGTTIRGLRPDWMTLALCAHGAKHGPYPWPAIKWVTDIEALVRAHPEEWWASVVSLSRDLGAYRMLLLGLMLSRDLDAPLPGVIREHIDRDAPILEGLIAPIRLRAFQPVPEPFPFSERLRFDLAVRERVRDRAGYLATRITTPGKTDLTETPASRGFLRVPRRFMRLGRQYLLDPSRGRDFLFGSGGDRPGSDS